MEWLILYLLFCRDDNNNGCGCNNSGGSIVSNNGNIALTDGNILTTENNTSSNCSCNRNNRYSRY